MLTIGHWKWKLAGRKAWVVIGRLSLMGHAQGTDTRGWVWRRHPEGDKCRMSERQYLLWEKKQIR